MGPFGIIIGPSVGAFLGEMIAGASSGFSNETSLNKLIINETKRTTFLNQVRKPALEISSEAQAGLKEEDAKLNPDEMAFKLQINSHYFYMYMWQSLTKEEKFLLYDLAEDNLVNSFLMVIILACWVQKELL